MKDQLLELVRPLAENLLVVVQVGANEVFLGRQVGHLLVRYAESPDGNDDDENGCDGEDYLAGGAVGEMGVLAAAAQVDDQANPVRQGPAEHEDKYADEDVYCCWKGVREKDADGPADGDEHETGDDGIEPAYRFAGGVRRWEWCGCRRRVTRVVHVLLITRIVWWIFNRGAGPCLDCARRRGEDAA